MEDRRILVDTSVVIDHFRKKNKQKSLLYELSKVNTLFLSASECLSDQINLLKIKEINVHEFVKQTFYETVKYQRAGNGQDFLTEVLEELWKLLSLKPFMKME